MAISLGSSQFGESREGLSGESINRLASSALIKNRNFATQGRGFGPVTAEAFAEGELRARAAKEQAEAIEQQKIRTEENRLREERRQFNQNKAFQYAEARREEKSKAKSFLGSILGAT